MTFKILKKFKEYKKIILHYKKMKIKIINKYNIYYKKYLNLIKIFKVS